MTELTREERVFAVENFTNALMAVAAQALLDMADLDYTLSDYEKQEIGPLVKFVKSRVRKYSPVGFTAPMSGADAEYIKHQAIKIIRKQYVTDYFNRISGDGDQR